MAGRASTLHCSPENKWEPAPLVGVFGGGEGPCLESFSKAGPASARDHRLGGIEVGSARSAFVISALLCLSNPAISAELDGSSDESPNRGALGHTTIRAYGAVVPKGWGSDYGRRPGWGTGFGLSYGISRAAQISIGFAYHRVNIIGSEDWDALRQVTTSIELVSPSQDFVRPWLGVGLGYYDSEQQYSTATTALDALERGRRDQFVTHQGSLGFNWGGGFALRLSRSVGVEAGARYNRSIDDPANHKVDLLSVQAGLSYAVR